MTVSDLDSPTEETVPFPSEAMPPKEVPPTPWSAWRGTRHRHAAANDPSLRAYEPAFPDATGAKYVVVGPDGPSGCLPLIPAIQRMIDQSNDGDRVVVFGSQRVVVSWRRDDRGLRPRLDYVGASAIEARAAEASGLLVVTGEDHVLLRVRMRRQTLERIRVASEVARRQRGVEEAKAGKYMSAWVLGLILDAIDRSEAQTRAVQAARFSGTDPLSDDEIRILAALADEPYSTEEEIDATEGHVVALVGRGLIERYRGSLTLTACGYAVLETA